MAIKISSVQLQIAVPSELEMEWEFVSSRYQNPFDQDLLIENTLHTNCSPSDNREKSCIICFLIIDSVKKIVMILKTNLLWMGVYLALWLCPALKMFTRTSAHNIPLLFLIFVATTKQTLILFAFTSGFGVSLKK